MRPKTNRLLLLMIGAMLAGCASQTERSASGAGGETAAPPAPQAPAPQAQPAPPPEYVPEAAEVQYVDRPLEPTPPPARVEEPLPDFPITTYEISEEEEVGDLGTQPDDSGTATYPEQDLGAAESTVGAPTGYAEEEEEEIGDLGTQPDDSGTVTYPEEDLGTAASTVGAPTAFAEEEEVEIGDLGTQEDLSGTMSYQEQDLGTSGSTVGAPTVYPDQVAVSLTFEAEPLFNFDKAFIRGDQRRILDEFVASLAGTEYESIEAVGFADRIGPEAYNQKLSERRAEAVKSYLAAKGIPAGKIRTEGRGEAETITGDACAKMRGKALIGCFQPDRRVDVTVTAVKLTN